MPPDAGGVPVFVARIARRLALRAAVEGAAAGLAAAALLAVVGWPARDGVVSPAMAGILGGAIGAAIRLVRGWPTGMRATAAAERAVPHSRNLILTAMELAAAPMPAPMPAPMAHRGTPGAQARDPHRSPGDVSRIVLARAADLVRDLDPAALIPARLHLAALAGAAALWGIALGRVTGGTFIGPATSVTAMIDRVDITVAPPAYTGLPPRVVRNPEQVELLEGSTMTARVRSNAQSITVSTADSTATRTITPAGDGGFTIRVPASAGMLALEPRAANGAVGPGRLVTLTVLPDAPPAVRIVSPGKDMVIPDGNRTIEVGAEASDDIALASLTLRYTKVAGSGERFTFVDGEVPVTVARTRATLWHARASWNLATLKLEAGDVVVYRAVATDARPGRAPVESDAFIAEVASPGSVAAGGFALSPDDDRYALSQQMIVLKTERLLARRAALSPASLADTAAAIAAEQRRVRAEFVFMMGGELDDAGADTSMTTLNEDAEAEGESDLLAGREANRGRMALRRATRAMSLAARQLDRTSIDSALTFARDAVKGIEDAFARDRILLRALAQRETLDPARRLTGTMTDLARGARLPLRPADDPRTLALRGALAEIARIANTSGGVPEASLSVASGLAVRLLRIDPASKPMQEGAAALAAAGTALARGDTVRARRSLGVASEIVAAELRRSLPSSASASPALEEGAARGAFTDILRGVRP